MSGRRTRDNRRAEESNRRGRLVLTIVLLLLIAFSLVGLLGGLGELLKTFFVGAFGFGAYAILTLALALVLLKGFRLTKRRVRVRALVYSVILFLLFMTYLQVMTSHKIFENLSDPNYRDYLIACYDAGLSTSGGVLFGLIAHPLLTLMGKYVAIPLAVFFFVVLFFALYPMMRGAAKSSVRAEKRAPVREKPVKKEKEKKVTVPEDKPLLLFVDKVRPGQKDAQKIKMRSFFSKKKEDPTFFDYYDTRPLHAPEGVVPEERPERLDLYMERRSDRTDDGLPDAMRDGYSTDDSLSSARNYQGYGEGEKSLPRDEYDDEELPDFVKKYAGERAEANRKLYGRDDLSTIIPDEPRFEGEEKSEQTTAPVSAPAAEGATPKRPTYMKPKARPGDIISDIHDLHRIKEKNGWDEKKSSFLGEDGGEAGISAPSVERTFSSPAYEAPARPAYSAPVAPERPAPVHPLYEQQRSERNEDLSDRAEVASSVITPRDASMMTPKENPYREPNRAPAEPVYRTPVTTKPFVQSEEEETPLRTRKPRSDIGGTHRTADSIESRGYIPPKQAKQMDIEQVMKEEAEAPARPYTAPPVHLLKDFPPVQDEEDVEESADMLVQALSSFNINSEVVDHKTGPTFTQFAVTLPDNMSVNKLTPLEKDIKRKLKIEKNIRIISSVPGLDAVGIEVPNKHTSTVGLRSIINSPDFTKENKLCFAIGVDVSGRAVYGDLLKMPHLLVAGSTGSGKSVCLNVMICSMMYHYSPEKVRFIMIDPKKVELSVYKNMPHMLMPSTVTEPDKAINALTWAVNEMERRYQVLMESDCRNIGEYNALQEKTGGKKMYYIVLIVDEMADLMSTAKRDVEEKVNRITSKARAAGIHIVVATQRPSVDVITGTIKNNIPTRIAFKVTSFTDSKTILDRGGAESLFGYGDMLYMPPEGGDPVRLQGPFINSEEISEIVRYVKDHNDCRFDDAAEKIIQAEKDPLPEQTQDAGDKGDEEDEYFAPALLYFIKVGQASISKLQIKYHIGYGRAARIVDTMAERGYLGPAEAGNKSRQVNMTLDEYYAIYGEDGIDGDEVL